MKLKELFTIGNGIFEKWFKPEYPTEYAKIFGAVDPRKLDVYTLLNYGEKEVCPNINETNVADIVGAVIALDLPVWLKQVEVMETEYNTTNPVKSEHIVTETRELNEQGNGTNTGANKAFNEAEFSDGERETTTDTTNRTETFTRKETVTGTGGKSLSDEIRKELSLRRENIKKSVIFAFVSELTLQIYE